MGLEKVCSKRPRGNFGIHLSFLNGYRSLIDFLIARVFFCGADEDQTDSAMAEYGWVVVNLWLLLPSTTTSEFEAVVFGLSQPAQPVLAEAVDNYRCEKNLVHCVQNLPAALE